MEAVLRIALIENGKLSTTDDLTRVASRRFFSKHFPREVERAARYGRAPSLILCDIDFFKNVNDTTGHTGGDQVLVHAVRRLRSEQTRGTQPRDGHEAHRQRPLNRRRTRVGENSRTLTQLLGVTALCALARRSAHRVMHKFCG